MRYLCAQPATLYYAWQIDTLIYNFINNNIKQEQIDIVCAVQNKIDDYFYVLEKKYPNVNFYFYNDTRTEIIYISSIRPHILKEHFKKHPDLYKGSFLYHDCDIALTKPLELDKYLCTCDSTNYLSDTRSYIGYSYIMEKGENVLDRMCQVLNIDKSIVKENQDNSGGAQYLLKNITYEYWEQVEIDSENLYKNISIMNKRIKRLNPSYHELQIWCADMWAVLWGLWKIGRKTKIIRELDFTFAVDGVQMWDRKPIYHNAGVTGQHEYLFNKGKYIDMLPPDYLEINPEKTSFKYYQEVKKALYGNKRKNIS